MSKYIDLAKKIKALAEKGTDGEKENAEFLLEKLMKKHNISEKDVDDEKVEFHCFNILRSPHDFDFMLLNQITGISNVKIYGQFSKQKQKQFGLNGNYAIECTKVLYLEISAKFEFYKARLLERSDQFFTAFCIKNNLLVDGGEDSELSEDQVKKYKKAYMLSQNLESDSFHKQISQ